MHDSIRNNKTKQLKLPYICLFLRHSGRKRGGLILYRSRADTATNAASR